MDLRNRSNWLKLKFRISKNTKNDIFWPFEVTKIWFHVKFEWQEKCKILTSCCLNSTFWKFLEHSELWFPQKIQFLSILANFYFAELDSKAQNLKFHSDKYKKDAALLNATSWMAIGAGTFVLFLVFFVWYKFLL